jgi:asparagine synthase (glutamine-hydrolysing)
MCGINAFNFSDSNQAQLMNEAIKHRGPDDQGVYTNEEVSLGSVRLSILDLSTAGHQPMLYRHGNDTAIIAYNGEIFNCSELRRTLEEKGYVFNSRTDTEVILASYLDAGTDCTKNLNGMWAFVIYDPAKHILFCSRDRVGKKPLYYYFDGEKFIISSELKGIITHDQISLNRMENISKDAVNLYFELGFIPAPYTIYKNTFKLEARQNLIFNLRTKEIRTWYYYDVPRFDPSNDYDGLVKQGKKLLSDAVRLRMIADVPVGAFLSGGLDSSTIVGLMKEFSDIKDLHTFSVGFEDEYDETPYIEKVRNYFGTIHHHHFLREQDFESLLHTYSTMYDEPLADVSGFPTYVLSKTAREHVTVILSGDGGDEIFGGYPEHVMGYRMDTLRKIPRPLRTVLSKGPVRKNLNSYTSAYLLKQALKVSLSDPADFYAMPIESDRDMPEVYKRWTKGKLELCIQGSHTSMAEALRLYDLPG